MKLGLCALSIGAIIAAASAVPAFARQASPAAMPAAGGLPETSWHLVEATPAAGAVRTPDEPALYTIQFLPEGRIAVRADCNQVGGAFEIDGDALTLTHLMTTLVGCPAGSLGQDYTAWLEQVVSYELTEAELILLLDDGGRLRFVPALGDVAWEWQGFEGGNDAILSPDLPAAYTLRFDPDGRLLVRADCNTGRGRYEVDGATIAIEAIALTRMACGEDSLADEFVQDLDEVTSFAFTSGQLSLVLPMDAGVLRLTARAGVEAPATPATGTPAAE